MGKVTFCHETLNLTNAHKCKSILFLSCFDLKTTKQIMHDIYRSSFFALRWESASLLDIITKFVNIIFLLK